MAQYRQSGARDYDPHHHHHHYSNGGGPDHVSLAVRAGSQQLKPARHRRFARSDKGRRISVGSIAFVLVLGLVVTVLAYYFLSRDSKDSKQGQEDDLKSDLDFLTNVTRTEAVKVLEFGKGSVAHGRDSRDWDKDDRRRDGDYNEDVVNNLREDANDGSSSKNQVLSKTKSGSSKKSGENSLGNAKQKGVGLYNEAGRDELKMYEAEYEASLKNSDASGKENDDENQELDDESSGRQNEAIDADDEYIGIDSSDAHREDRNDVSHDYEDTSDFNKPTEEENTSLNKNTGESFEVPEMASKGRSIVEVVKKVPKNLVEEENLRSQGSYDPKKSSGRTSSTGGQATKKSRSDSKRRKRHSCEMKIYNSTTQLMEPILTRKFARFALQYVEEEEKPDGEPDWEPRFAGHQSLEEREASFLAQDQKINCGFVKGPEGSPSTGFDLAEDDANYISRCHIAVVSCIFGNSDRLRTPANKMITRQSRKNVCFVMFVDEITLRTLNSEGHMLDTMGFIGLWKIVVVKNLPYTDMRRVGKIPKLLSHRLFPSARYSIWLDSKLRLQLDPLLILEYFLWRKGHEYAISNHYDRHCVWEEVAQNKKLNKYNHTVIDQQFAFYQADGLKRFNPVDPLKLLPSNVPEGSFIVRAHTPMSNLFSCLWFNEVERFTPRDQLSFAYTYQKLRSMNPSKPFHLNMFKDCERRRVAKLFRHRSEERRNLHQQAIE
ncbi:uncharacterized protein LOC116204908 isoform X2 [Punica granatum]|uniref:Uncharacterized protein LOC116204908 isoform X2 n=1 Tax=Punica granatum TaxID=22663 RepID=A0A6P8DII4_PUNGR|nr:uncharacterized protein LOC116204908 isoform X2 [Punica granatum]